MIKTKTWFINGKEHRNEIDPDTGLILHSYSSIGGGKAWHKYGKFHRDEIDPETKCFLPAVFTIRGDKYWYKDGIEFTPTK
jgi:hypothetical protein